MLASVPSLQVEQLDLSLLAIAPSLHFGQLPSSATLSPFAQVIHPPAGTGFLSVAHFSLQLDRSAMANEPSSHVGQLFCLRLHRH